MNEKRKFLLPNSIVDKIIEQLEWFGYTVDRPKVREKYYLDFYAKVIEANTSTEAANIFMAAIWDAGYVTKAGGEKCKAN